MNNNNNNDLLDILGSIELPTNILKEDKKEFVPEKKVTLSFNMTINNFTNKVETKGNLLQNVKKESKILKQISHSFIFGVKYILTSVSIFGVLLVSTNFSAYTNIIESYIYEDTEKESSMLLLNSANADEVKEEKIIYKKTKAQIIKEFRDNAKKVETIKNTYSIKQIISSSDDKDIDLGINVVPYENRIVIPKIGKNIPLIDIKEKTVESKNKLDNIFMKELESGVVRYPGSAQPGQNGNSFIFGHSSNFPWIAGDYNEVFARLGQVNKGDIVFSYYGQKKYKYKIIEKKVVKPNDVGVLKNDETKKQLTLMTCWPIGTTLNRLILTAELIEE